MILLRGDLAVCMPKVKSVNLEIQVHLFAYELTNQLMWKKAVAEIIR